MKYNLFLRYLTTIHYISVPISSTLIPTKLQFLKPTRFYFIKLFTFYKMPTPEISIPITSQEFGAF